MAQAELPWVPGSAVRWFTHPKMVTHPGTNWAFGCRETMLIETTKSKQHQTNLHVQEIQCPVKQNHTINVSHFRRVMSSTRKTAQLSLMNK